MPVSVKLTSKPEAEPFTARLTFDFQCKVRLSAYVLLGQNELNAITAGAGDIKEDIRDVFVDKILGYFRHQIKSQIDAQMAEPGLFSTGATDAPATGG